MADRVNIEQLTEFGLASIMAHRTTSALQIGAALGISVPDGPEWAGGGDLELIGTGPGTWLAFQGNVTPFWAHGLRERLEGVASVSDQSSAYHLLRLSGAAAQAVLQKGVSIDLTPHRFPIGAAATTMIGHIGVILRRIDDAPTYEVATFRSYAASFREWLDRAVAAL